MTDEARQIIPGQPVQHPGTVAAERITAVAGTTRPFTSADVVDAARRGRSDRDVSTLLTTETRSLFDVMVAAVEATGADSGVVEFSGLSLPFISYCFPAYGGTDRPMLYSATHESAGIVLQGTATVGFRRDPDTAQLSRWIHFHITWLSESGHAHGGHLWPETTMDGAFANATVWPLYGIDLVNALCEETHLPVFTPEPAHSTGAPLLTGDRRAVFARVRPNVELVTAISDLTHTHDLAGGTVRGGTGSLVGGATFTDRVVSIGPATEVISLSGVLGLSSDDGASTYACTFVAAGGAVHGGRLQRDGNIVGATYDLMLAGPVHD